MHREWDMDGLSHPRNVFMMASANSLHEQRLLQGVAHYGRIQSPPWIIRWAGMQTHDIIRQQGYEGMIYFALPDNPLFVPKDLDIPSVNVSSRNRHLGGAGVTPDDSAIGKLAAGYFKDLLYTNFAFVGARSHTYSVERFNSFAEAVAPAPCAAFFAEDYMDKPLSVISELFNSFLRNLPNTTAVFTANDNFARSVCQHALSVGRIVPDELAVLGVDADELISMTCPVSLSSIDPDSFRIGYTAAETLAKMMDDPSYRPGNRSIAPCRVISAASSDHLATKDKVVAKAVQTIRLHACRGLTVDDVAKALGVGRRSLELRFKQAIGRGVDAQIRSVRLERARELLERTDMPLGEVAEKSGFAHPFYLSNVFKKNFGCSPTVYREQKTRRIVE